jgi:peptide-methionine (S)-S-oxide reductase
MKGLFVLRLALLCSALACKSGPIAEPKQHAQMPDADQITPPKGSSQRDTATLGGGCFWCVEAIYQDLQGVHKVVSGYAGGSVANPTYKEICTGTTGHAEVIQVVFDPAVVRYDEILEIFFTVHDPTTLNRQGNDVGTQYRSVIFYHSEAQKESAEKVKKDAAAIWDDPIVTEIAPLTRFYPAEDYHQNYYKDNPYQPYCAYIISPKVKKFREKYKDKLKQ